MYSPKNIHDIEALIPKTTFSLNEYELFMKDHAKHFEAADAMKSIALKIQELEIEDEHNEETPLYKINNKDVYTTFERIRTSAPSLIEDLEYLSFLQTQYYEKLDTYQTVVQLLQSIRQQFFGIVGQNDFDPYITLDLPQSPQELLDEVHSLGDKILDKLRTSEAFSHQHITACLHLHSAINHALHIQEKYSFMQKFEDKHPSELTQNKSILDAFTFFQLGENPSVYSIQQKLDALHHEYNFQNASVTILSNPEVKKIYSQYQKLQQLLSSIKRGL